ncbi:helix-turn-helix domain-containing protein [Lacticaseibacillus songhuajiangensis]|jgi:transcriptional regulator with XRE-family HTH domain|uniref:helix-turn-helix domain-containing protein n=1 Tax=Lacticaseibacillus songhuajiangensis TaxID=1296539 RepID=UPI000F785D5E|nr:helix-turn-helix transcriptional regulator [Lacticaseibacillus songhuajiangensis]
MATLQSRLIDLRESKNMSQAELARRMQVDGSIISKIESGARKVSSEELAKLASIYEVTTDYLLGINKTPAWATEKQVTDLKDWLDDPDAMDGFSFGGTDLTEDEKAKLKMSMTQIFWDRLELDRMPMPDTKYMRKNGDDK